MYNTSKSINFVFPIIYKIDASCTRLMIMTLITQPNSMKKQEQIILCIPRMATDVPKELIASTFKKMNLGNIDSIYESQSQHMPQYKRVLIYIKWDYNSPMVQQIMTHLENNQTIKIVYDMPWYWICVKYVKPKPVCLISPESLFDASASPVLCNG